MKTLMTLVLGATLSFSSSANHQKISVDGRFGAPQIADAGGQQACIELLKLIRETQRIIASGAGDKRHREYLENLKAIWETYRCEQILSGG